MRPGELLSVQDVPALQAHSRAFGYAAMYNWFIKLPPEARTGHGYASVEVPETAESYDVTLKGGGRRSLKTTFVNLVRDNATTVTILSRPTPADPSKPRPPEDLSGSRLLWRRTAAETLELRAADAAAGTTYYPVLWVETQGLLYPAAAEAQVAAIGRLILGQPAGNC